MKIFQWLYTRLPSPTGRMRGNYIPPQYFEYSKSVGGVDNCSVMQVVGELFLIEFNIWILMKELYTYT